MYLNFEDISELVVKIQALVTDQTQTVLILLSDQHEKDVSQLIELLKATEIKFFGAIFPGLIDGGVARYSGAILQVFEMVVDPVVVDMDRLDENTVGQFPVFENESFAAQKCGFVFIDCFSPNIDALLMSLQKQYGQQVKLVGAGAGNRNLEKNPCVFCNDGLFKHAAIFGITVNYCDVSIRHGWQHYQGPFIVTSCDKNIIHEFNWKPAYEVYLEAIPPEHRIRCSHDNFYANLASRYPLGIQMPCAEDVIRDPVDFTDEGALVCLSDIPDNSVLHMVQADQERLVNAAANAVLDVACQEHESETGNRVFVSNCYSRALLMGENFRLELEAANQMSTKIPGCKNIEGVLALGEIASCSPVTLEFYNKTFVAVRV